VPGLDPHGVEHLAHTSIFIWHNLKEVLVPLAIGIGVFVLGAWPDLFGARRRGPNIFEFRLPRWLGVDYWYVRSASGSLALLFVGKRIYAPVKQWVVEASKRVVAGTAHLVRDIVYPALTDVPFNYVKETTIRVYGDARARMLPAVREYQGDIAVGALVIVVSLTIFLIMRLL
ncbi:MAG: hypothetical protein ACOC78_03550, partial [Actinomycetota bacterium]